MRNIVPAPKLGETMTIIEAPCFICGEVTRLKANSDDVRNWKRGKNVKLAFPYLSREDQEFLITQMCEECSLKY